MDKQKKIIMEEQKKKCLFCLFCNKPNSKFNIILGEGNGGKSNICSKHLIEAQQLNK